MSAMHLGQHHNIIWLFNQIINIIIPLLQTLGPMLTFNHYLVGMVFLNYKFIGVSHL